MRCQALDQAKVHLQKEKLPTKQSNGQPACATNCQKTVLQIGPRQLTGGHIRGYPPYYEGVAEQLNATALKTTSFRPKSLYSKNKSEKPSVFSLQGRRLQGIMQIGRHHVGLFLRCGHLGVSKPYQIMKPVSQPSRSSFSSRI